MLIYNQKHGYLLNRTYVQGKSFMDSLKSIGSYISQNKYLIAKLLFGAAGDLAKFGISEGGKATIVPYKVSSSIECSHRRAVTEICWLPCTYEVTNTGKVPNQFLFSIKIKN